MVCLTVSQKEKREKGHFIQSSFYSIIIMVCHFIQSSFYSIIIMVCLSKTHTNGRFIQSSFYSIIITVCLSKTHTHTHKWLLYSEFTLFNYNYGLSLKTTTVSNLMFYAQSTITVISGQNNNKLVTLFRVHLIQLYGLSLSLLKKKQQQKKSHTRAVPSHTDTHLLPLLPLHGTCIYIYLTFF